MLPAWGHDSLGLRGEEVRQFWREPWILVLYFIKPPHQLSEVGVSPFSIGRNSKFGEGRVKL